MKITCFGEVLWDIFPTHRKIGGAPLNVALRLHTMGIYTSLISRIGNDDLGSDIVAYVEKQGMRTNIFQEDIKHITGEVLVTLDSSGTASYEISKPVAWDFIEYTKEMEQLVVSSDAFVFGSLASRNEESRNTLLKLLGKAQYKVLDVNLRPPHYDVSLLWQLMDQADFIKLNDEELEEICEHLNIQESTLENQVKALAKETKTDQICITKGGKGAALFFDNEFYTNPGYKIQVVDTVGAGDSFLATLISKLLIKSQPQEAINLACAVGAMVAGSKGANPIFSKEEIEVFMHENAK